MKPGRLIEIAREADKRWQRWRKPLRSVLVDARTPMNYAIIAPIHKAMRSDQRVQFYFTSSEAPNLAAKIFSEADETARIISPRRAAMMRFDAYLVADLLWVRLPRGTRRILMFHGVAGKYGNVYDSPDHSMRDWDRLFFINQRRLRNFIAAGAIDADSAAARLVGYPKLDCLVDGSLKRNEVLGSLGLDPEKKTVLYAPTWSPYSSLNAMGEDLVKQLCDAGYQVVVKLHDRSRDAEYIHSGGIDWAARIGTILEKGGGHLAIHSDATPYLAAADVLITDHSSVGFEYLLLDRPLVRIEMPELIAATNINTDYVSLMAESSLTVRTSSQAVDAVERSFADSSSHSQARKKVAAELFHQPGSATLRAVNELYEILELDPIQVEAIQPVAQLVGNLTIES